MHANFRLRPCAFGFKEDESLGISQPRTPLVEGVYSTLLNLYIITHIVSVVLYLYLYKIKLSVVFYSKKSALYIQRFEQRASSNILGNVRRRIF